VEWYGRVTCVYRRVSLRIALGVLTNRSQNRVVSTSLLDRGNVVGCEIPRKENSPIFNFFCTPPLPVSPGSPEVDPTIEKNKRPGFKKMG